MKKSITIRIDEDVLEWFRSSGSGYQSRMNDALRKHMEFSKRDRMVFGMEGIVESAPTKQDVIDSLEEQVDSIPVKKVDPYFRPMEKKGSKKG